jgi:uncharacterized protein (TIGR02301 family)
MRSRRRIGFAGLGLALTLAGGALAADPPYAKALGRLAEILGSLHYLAGLCAPEPSPWRAQMEILLADENPDAAFRARLVDRFNIGFSSFAAVYRRCGPSAEAAIERYRSEGAALTVTINEEFGRPIAAEAPARGE